MRPQTRAYVGATMLTATTAIGSAVVGDSLPFWATVITFFSAYSYIKA